MLVEKYRTLGGEDYAKKWSVFPVDPSHGHVPGDEVQIVGIVSASVYSFVNQDGAQVHVATMTVNKAKFAGEKNDKADTFADTAADAIQSIGGSVKDEMPF